MEKHSGDAKSKSNREASSGSRSEHSRKRLQEPPKFYSKNYLKRYNHGEVRGVQAPPPPPSQAVGKKSSPTDQTQTARSQHKEAPTNPTSITISSTILKLTENDEESTTNERDSSARNPSPAEISKNESRAQQQRAERDYRYSLVNAMSSVKSSYLRRATEQSANEEEEEAEEQPYLRAEWTSSETLRKIRSRVEEALKLHKVFLIRGELPRLKEALEERGWIQKYEPSRTRSLPYGSGPLSPEASGSSKSLGELRLADGAPNERALTYALLRQAQPDFIWDCRNEFAEWDRGIAGGVLLNRLQRPALYTSKLGMAHVLQEAHWLHETDVADVLFPRCYNPGRELAELRRDFRRCAALALLRRFVIERSTRRTDNDRGAVEQDGDQQCNEKADGNIETLVSLDRIEFAVKCCEEHIAELEHEDIDAEVDSEMSEEEWRLFSEDYDRLLYRADGMASLPKDDPDRLEDCYAAAHSVLNKLKNIDPQFELNGERNIWIVKPSNLCCGSGIFMTHDLKTILRKVESKPKDYYVVQKYIERPFLVYGTKFDIRQWFLVTSTFPLTIWSFKEALLRMSSKPYSSATYHEAIHICNTAVQERYDCERRRRQRNHRAAGEEVDEEGGGETTTTVRDQGWDCEKLNEYLKSVGYEGEPYYERIYPKMSQAIVLTMLAAQDFMDRRRRSFELYGADFMVMEDLSVWLIEINTNPRMHPPSSRITQRLYDSVLDGLVKVIMDVPLEPTADTGGFELVYRQSVPESQPYLGPCLFAFGKSVKLHEPPASGTLAAKRRTMMQQQSAAATNVWVKQYRAWTAPPMIERLREPRVVDFITYLNNAPKLQLQPQQQQQQQQQQQRDEEDFA